MKEIYCIKTKLNEMQKIRQRVNLRIKEKSLFL